MHGEKQLYNSAYPDKMRKAAEASMQKRGINLVLGDFVDLAETAQVEGVTTRSGKSLKSVDLVVCTIHYRIRSASLILWLLPGSNARS